MMFVTVTGDHLIVGTRRIVIYSLISICVGTPMTFTLHFYPPYVQYWQIPCYAVSYCVLGVTLCTFSNMFRSLFRAATTLNSCFKVRNSFNFTYENFHVCLYSVIPSVVWHILYEISLFNFASFSQNLLIIIESKLRNLRFTWVNLRGTAFVKMCKEMILTQDSDTWKMFEFGRLKIMNRTLIIQLPY